MGLDLEIESKRVSAINVAQDVTIVALAESIKFTFRMRRPRLISLSVTTSTRHTRPVHPDYSLPYA